MAYAIGVLLVTVFLRESREAAAFNTELSKGYFGGIVTDITRRNTDECIGLCAMSSFLPQYTLKEGLARTLEFALPSSFSLGKAQASLGLRSCVRRFEFVHLPEDAVEFVSE